MSLTDNGCPTVKQYYSTYNVRVRKDKLSINELRIKLLHLRLKSQGKKGHRTETQKTKIHAITSHLPIPITQL